MAEAVKGDPAIDREIEGLTARIRELGEDWRTLRNLDRKVLRNLACALGHTLAEATFYLWIREDQR